MAATHLVMNTTALKRVLWLQRKSRVVIRSPRLGQIERRNLQERINRWLGVSGYGVGLAAVVVALVLCGLWIGGHWGFFVAHRSRAVVLVVEASLCAVGLGRAIGFLYARWSLARAIWSIEALMEDYGGDVQSIGARRAALLRRSTMAQ